MKTLLEILTEICGTVELNRKEYFEIQEEEMQAAHDDYCKQFEPIYQYQDNNGAWFEIEQSQYKRFSIYNYRTVYLAPQPMLSEVKAYIERLEDALGYLDAIYYEKVKKLKASKPAILKD